MAKTIDELKTQSEQIKNASVVGENTATRVGTLFGDVVGYIQGINKNLLGVCYTRGFVPNIDSSARTLDLGGDFIIRTRFNNYIIKDRAIPLCDTTLSSSAQMLIFDTATQTFKHGLYTYILGDTEILIGFTRFFNNTDYPFYKFDAAFDFTVDGKTPIADNSVTNAKIAEREQSVCSIIYSNTKRLINFNTSTGKMEIPADTGFRTSKGVKYLTEDVEVNYKSTTGANTTAIFLNISTNEFRVGNSASVVGKDNEILVCLGRMRFDKNGFDFILGGDYTVNGRLSKCDFYNGEITINEFTEANMSKYKESGVANNRRWFLMPAPIIGKYIEIIANENYNVAVLYLDSKKNILSDTRWIKSYTAKFSYGKLEDVSYIRISLRRVDNKDMTDEETYSTAVSSFNYVLPDSDFLISNYTNNIINTLIKNIGIKLNLKKSIKNIAHQGYNIVDSEYFGNSRVSSYIAAAKAGFDFGECDLKFTSDNVAVCCHDDTFRDTVTGELITISEHTLAELKTYTYYHEKIASFEEVVSTCKIYGIGIYIDKIGLVNSSDKWQHLFSILKKYKMEERVWWLTPPRTEIIDFYNRSKFSWVLSEINDSTIESINNLHTQYPDCEITIDVNYSNLSIEDLIRYNSMLSTGVSIEVWTIDDKSIYKQYIPYVSGITSNKISEPMIWED